MKNKVFTYCLFFLAGAHIAAAQKPFEIDSLKTVFFSEKGLADSTRSLLCSEIAYSYYNVQPDSSLLYAKKGLELAGSWPKGMARAQRVMGIYHILKNDYNNGLALYFAAEKNAQSAGDLFELGRVYNNFGRVYFSQGIYDKSLEYNFLSVGAKEKTGDKTGLGLTYLGIAHIYLNMGDLKNAEVYTNKGLLLQEYLKNTQGAGLAFYLLGKINGKKEDKAKEEFYYHKSNDAAGKIDDRLLIINIQMDLGNLYISSKKFDEASECFAKAMLHAEFLKNDSHKAGIFANMAKCENVQSHWEKGFEMANKALLLLKKAPHLEYYAHAAEQYAIASEKLGLFKEAYQMQKLYKQKSDSLISVKNSQFGIVKSFEYSESKEKTERLKEIAEARYRLVIIAAVAVLLAITSGFYYAALRRKKKDNALLMSVNDAISKQKEESVYLNQELEKALGLAKSRHEETLSKKAELEKLNEVKNRLFSIIAHDLRTPVGNLQGILQLLQEGAIAPEDQKTILAELSANVGQTTDFLNTLLIWAKSQMEGIKLKYTLFDLSKIPSETEGVLKASLEHKKITFANHIPRPLLVECDKNALKLVFNNLIANAIKFSFPGGKIDVGVSLNGNDVTVFVKDTGKGIPEADIPKLFGLGSHTTPGTQNEKGTGLGLNLCKEFLEKLGGKIWAESEQGEGSCFYFTFPLRK